MSERQADDSFRSSNGIQIIRANTSLCEKEISPGINVVS